MIVARAQSQPNGSTYVVTSKKSYVAMVDFSREDVMSMPKARYAIFNMQNILDILCLNCYDPTENAEATSALFHDIYAITDHWFPRCESFWATNWRNS
jgi:hypothetical protein